MLHILIKIKIIIIFIVLLIEKVTLEIFLKGKKKYILGISTKILCRTWIKNYVIRSIV